MKKLLLIALLLAFLTPAISFAAPTNNYELINWNVISAREMIAMITDLQNQITELKKLVTPAAKSKVVKEKVSKKKAQEIELVSQASGNVNRSKFTLATFSITPKNGSIENLNDLNFTIAGLPPYTKKIILDGEEGQETIAKGKKATVEIVLSGLATSGSFNYSIKDISIATHKNDKSTVVNSDQIVTGNITAY